MTEELVEKKEHIKKFKTVPETLYFHSNKEFGEALGKDFIEHANAVTSKNKIFLVGLAHGQSPSYAYEYILEHYTEIENSHLIWYTFTNSRLKRQRNLDEIIDSFTFVRALLKNQLVSRDQVLGADFERDNFKGFVKKYNKEVNLFLKENKKKGYDYVFIASDPLGKVAGISRNSSAFDSSEIMVLVEDENTEPEITVTPNFLLKSSRLAFIATKADKRRSLAWLYSKWSNENESPSFLRFIPKIEQKMSVFIDDEALTWPQIELKRSSDYGISKIKLDFALPFDEKAKVKKPVIIMIHGFLGLNSFDSLLTNFSTEKYTAVAMHYGSIPNDLPQDLYSRHIVNNINYTVNYFGKLGHDVFILDHSIANTYFLMMDKYYHKLSGIKKYLKGRIGINPFFGEEAKHASLGFLDYVIIPSLHFKSNPALKSSVVTTRALMPFDSKKGARRKGIRITKWLIKGDDKDNTTIWTALKERIVTILTNMDSLPFVNIIPLKKALGRLNSKIFAIQIYSALTEYKDFDYQSGLTNFTQQELPILIIKSKKDGIAKYVEKFYTAEHTKVVDVTNTREKNLFREHLYHMIHPVKTVEMVDEFISKVTESV